VVSALYLGILAGSAWLDPWVTRWGHAKSYGIFALWIALLILLQALWVEPYYWIFLRFLGGMGIAGIFIVIESWLLMRAGPLMRGGILSVYLATFYGALSGGQLIVPCCDPMSFSPFGIAALLSALSVLPLVWRRHSVSAPKLGESAKLPIVQLFRISPLGFFGGVVSGALLAGIHGLVPVFAKEIGMSISEIGNLMALLILGGLLFQWPMGRWADRGDRKRVLLAASLFTAIFGIALALLDHSSTYSLFALAFLFGGFSFTIYPISMAYACEKLSDAEIIPATGGFVFSYGIGAIAGPLAAPLAMSWLGAPGLFYFLSALSLSLLLFHASLQIRQLARRAK
jgi:MFS family permease